MRRILILAAVLACLLIIPVPAAMAAQAYANTPGNAALDWAEAHATGCWYHYGGTSCSPGYDCSGLISTAILHATGIWIGRTTYEMLSTSGSHPQPGSVTVTRTRLFRPAWPATFRPLAGTYLPPSLRDDAPCRLKDDFLVPACMRALPSDGLTA